LHGSDHPIALPHASATRVLAAQRRLKSHSERQLRPGNRRAPLPAKNPCLPGRQTALSLPPWPAGILRSLGTGL